jgi:hypothetical protein
MIARIAAHSSVILASVILDGLSPMAGHHIPQDIIPFHNFKVLHLGSPISFCWSVFPNAAGRRQRKAECNGTYRGRRKQMGKNIDLRVLTLASFQVNPAI